MADQTAGYYISHKEKLLKGFDATCALVRASLVARYGETLANALENETRQQYEELIPEIPFIKGPRARALNTFLLISAQELAVYKTLAKRGKSPAEAWELCHAALRLRLAAFPQWKRRFMRRFMFSGLVRRIVARRARKKQRLCYGDFEIEYVVGKGEDFHFGVNYLQCGNYKFVAEHGGKTFAPFVCMSDIALGEAMGWGLIRTQTLADGCPHCDFRFKQGAVTQISSKTAEVQETIERIRKKEAEHVGPASR
ncbi:L-2-amino-thiazoline-4-carboxylic acid hydrolase [Verrucomicrobiota bacterium]